MASGEVKKLRKNLLVTYLLVVFSLVLVLVVWCVRGIFGFEIPINLVVCVSVVNIQILFIFSPFRLRQLLDELYMYKKCNEKIFDNNVESKSAEV